MVFPKQREIKYQTCARKCIPYVQMYRPLYIISTITAEMCAFVFICNHFCVLALIYFFSPSPTETPTTPSFSSYEIYGKTPSARVCVLVGVGGGIHLGVSFAAGVCASPRRP